MKEVDLSSITIEELSNLLDKEERFYAKREGDLLPENILYSNIDSLWSFRDIDARSLQEED